MGPSEAESEQRTKLTLDYVWLDASDAYSCVLTPQLTLASIARRRLRKLPHHQIGMQRYSRYLAGMVIDCTILTQTFRAGASVVIGH